jgi:outer membrane protein assembly factor BamB
MWALKTKTYTLICVILIGALYLLGFTGNLRLFLSYFIAAYIVVAVATFIYLGSLLLKFLPARLSDVHSRRPLRYLFILLTPVLLFILATTLSRTFAPHQHGIASVFVVAGTLIFSVFILWNLIREGKWKVLVFGTIVFSVYLISVTEWASGRKKVPQESSLEELAALPYVAFAPIEGGRGKSGVTLHKTNKALSGINLYAPNHASEAFLSDMNGKVLHKWWSKKDWEVWSHVVLNKNGDLLTIYKDRRLTRLSWDSSVVWRKRGRFHHDARFAKNGDIYALSRNDELMIHHFLPVPVLTDYILIFSAEGQLKKTYSVFDSLKAYIRPGKIVRIYGEMIQPRTVFQLTTKLFRGSSFLFVHTSPFDLFHTNSVEVVESPNGLFNQGDLLISARNVSIVAVLNPQTGKILWESNQFTMQHQPGFLPDGNILVFDNGVPSTKSRIAEVDPRTGKIVWEYKSEDFYAHNRGGTQRLSNGNTLITESPDGRAFEVTKDREMVWEFFTPEIYEGKRSVIYRLMRFSKSDGYSCLDTFFESELQSKTEVESGQKSKVESGK